jgi:hypothetical protein
MVRIEIGNTGEFEEYENLDIKVDGIKFANPTNGQCIVSITNLKRATSQDIVTRGSPYSVSQVRQRIQVLAGRADEELGLLYDGLIFRAKNTQPPDIVTIMTCINQQVFQDDAISISIAPGENLSVIAQEIADKNGLKLDFGIDDRVVKSGFSYSGSASKSIYALKSIQDMNVFYDYGTLFIRQKGVVTGNQLILNPDNIVGTPEYSDTGMICTFMYSQGVRLSDAITMESVQFPELNRDYYMAQLSYNLTNRDIPWYYTANCVRGGLAA